MVEVSFQKPSAEQLELKIENPRYPDRNWQKGGRSFYFFDFDDNVMFLPTPLFLFHKKTGEEKAISTREFAFMASKVGVEKPWHEFEINFDPIVGSFRRFRHQKIDLIQKIKGQKQPLVEDLLKTIKNNALAWRGPSWNFFWHAVHNERPLSIITARGHRPETIVEAIDVLKNHGHLTRTPNYLSVFPVSNPDTRKFLGDQKNEWGTSKLKKEAIKYSVYASFKEYGENPSHRFGMSDDDPANLALIIEAMGELKKEFPENSFFVIDTHGGKLHKQEVFLDHLEDRELPTNSPQLNLF